MESINQIPKPIKDVVFIQANPNKNATRKLTEDVEIVIDTAFHPHATEYVTQEGKVINPPTKLSNKKPVELKAGDYVYTHHFLCDEDQSLELDGKKFYQLHYELVHCIVNKGKIKMLSDWNLIEPIEKKEQTTESGLVIVRLDNPKEPLSGTARHISKGLKDLGVKKGDKIYFSKDSDYEIIIEGKTYYRMRDRDILGIVN